MSDSQWTLCNKRSRTSSVFVLKCLYLFLSFITEESPLIIGDLCASLKNIDKHGDYKGLSNQFGTLWKLSRSKEYIFFFRVIIEFTCLFPVTWSPILQWHSKCYNHHNTITRIHIKLRKLYEENLLNLLSRKIDYPCFSFVY